MGPNGLRRCQQRLARPLIRLAEVFQSEFPALDALHREPRPANPTNNFIIQMMTVVNLQDRPTSRAIADLDAEISVPGNVIE